MSDHIGLRRRILVVDDDQPSIQLYQLILTRKGGYDVVVSEDPEEIVGLLKSRTISLVIMDVSLRNSRYKDVPVDGLAITRILKVNPETADVPVLIATAHAMRGDRELFLDGSQADDYISKPLSDTDEFLQKVEQLIASAQV